MPNQQIEQTQATKTATVDTRRSCVGCGWEGTVNNPFVVTSDVRRWKEENFRLWKCPVCGSIHAMDTVDLAHYYEGYPLHWRKLDFFARCSFGRLLKEMVDRGLRPNHKILDFGCGKGALVEFLKENGFPHATGYDPYSPGFSDTAVFKQPQDVLCAIDVLEHVEDPLTSMKNWANQVRPGGLCVISTPLADRIDPRHPEQFRHHLHQPFHRNLLSRRAVTRMAQEAGFTVEWIEERSMMDTKVPGVNWAFLETLFREAGDDTLDVGFDPVSFRVIKALPKMLIAALFGYRKRDRVNGIFYLRRKQTSALRPLPASHKNHTVLPPASHRSAILETATESVGEDVMLNLSIEEILKKGTPTVGHRPRLLFMPESASVAHLGRLLTLAQELPSHLYDIAFACDRSLRARVPLPFQWRRSTSHRAQEFRDRLDQGRTLLDENTIHQQVNEDLALFNELRPAIVIGDFRPSLAISAPFAGIHYINVLNAHWSPWASASIKAPGGLNTWWCRFLGDRWGKVLVDVLMPIGFRLQARPFNKVRRVYGLPPLPGDIRSIYSAGDTVVYADLPELVPTPNAPASHHHIGPILWNPTIPFPAWWETVPKDRPRVFVSVGSTGNWAAVEKVLRALRDLPVITLVATSGRGTVDPIPDRVYVSDTLPGTETCRQCDLVICNGGAGTVYQALSVGVPVIGIAANPDQMSVMAPVEKNGAGRCIPVGQTDRTDWAKEIATLLYSSDARMKARSFAAQMTRYPIAQNFLDILNKASGAAPVETADHESPIATIPRPGQQDAAESLEVFDYAKAFSRNLGLVQPNEQHRLKNSVVAIAGLGGVGGVHLTTLARLGIGEFHIADFDSFEIQNFNRQAGATVSSLGRAKVDVMAEQLLDINPTVRLKRFDQGIHRHNVEAFLDGVDVIVDGLDFFAVEAREMLFDEAERRGIPLITAGPIGMSVAWLIFQPGSMRWRDYFAFHLAKSASDKFLLFALGLTPRATQMSYLDRNYVNLEEHRGPSMALAVQLCAGVAAAEVVKLLLGRGTVKAAPSYHQFDAYKGRLVEGKLRWGNRGWGQRLKAAIYRWILNKKGIHL